MSKTIKTTPKIYCERYRRHSRAFNSFDKNIKRTMKKVIVSQKTCMPRDNKTVSTGIISNGRESQVTTPKKTAKSDVIFNHNKNNFGTVIDYCANCGDMPSNTKENTKSVLNRHKNRSEIICGRNSVNKIITQPLSTVTKPLNICENKPIQQYYRNENFFQSSDSIYATNNMKKFSLNTIIEHPEKISESDTIYEIYPGASEEDIGFMNPDDHDNISKLKEFRKNNYFECHSVKSRIHSKGSVTSLNDHKCVYRFYLNDRLFPVPLNTDHQGNIRCIQCHLPLDNDLESPNINGTVQAKVKLNSEIQDMFLMLPVKNSLIVTERRKKLQLKTDLDSVYFGIIKLDLNGDSIFSRSLPTDSLALRYQKGYKQLTVNKRYEFNSVGNDDIIII